MERYRIVKDVALYYITFSVVEWLPVFIDETACRIVTDSLNYCIRNKFLAVNAYVIMPTHLHAVVFDTLFDADRLKHTLDDMRKFTGRQLVEHAAQHVPPIYGNAFKENAGKDRKHRFWQPTQHPVGITTESFWKQKVEYLHYNPCRKGLVTCPDDWRFSSARTWLTGKAGDVQIADIGWYVDA
jgi:REP element-mobilizing transposase RayT